MADRVQAHPDLLNQIWEEEDVTDPDVADLDEDHDKLMEDHVGLGRVINDDPQRFPWMGRALHGTGSKVEFEYGYGPGFVITPQEAAEIAFGLAEEGWWSPGDEVVTIDHAIAEFYTAAARDGRVVIGGIGEAGARGRQCLARS